MRVIQPRTSWYNETLVSGNWLGEAANETAARAISGAGTGSYYHNTTDGKFYSLNSTSGQTEVFRGNKAGFPEEYVVVAEASRVIIFDATDPDLPMWMVFVGASGRMVRLHTSSIKLLDGLMVVGGNISVYDGVSEINLLSEGWIIRTSTGAWTTGESISGRNTSGSWVDTGGNKLANSIVNDVAITVLPDEIGQTIAVATDGNGTYLASIIRADGSVWDIAAAGGYTAASITFDGSSLCVVRSDGTAFVWNDAGNITADGTAPDATYTDFIGTISMVAA